MKKIIKKNNVSDMKTALNKVDLKTKENNYKNLKTHKKLSDNDINNLTEILKRVKINSTKGYYDTAKGLIIEGLSIDKTNRDLNFELAKIYEKEKNYQNSEYIYNDLLEIFNDDTIIMKRLGFIYVNQGKTEQALDIYTKINRKKSSDDEVINMLSEITFELKKYKLAIKYIKQFLKNKPRDIEKLNMKAICHEELRDFKDSVESHNKILESQPYNTNSRDKIKELSQYI